MDLLASAQEFWSAYGNSIINFIAAVGYLIAFYIVARIAKSVVRKLLNKTDVDNRFIHAVGLESDFPIESVVAGIIFWVVMLFGFVTFFEKLELEMVATPINELLKELTLFLPKIGAALGLLLLAWILASLVKIGINKASDAGRLDQRVNDFEENSEDSVSIGDSLAQAGYWFVFLLFLPMILSVLDMDSLVSPLQDMFSKLFSFLPNILSCALIFVVGNFVAKVVRKVVTGLLAASGVDAVTEKVGVKQNISTLIGTLVFTSILLLVIVQALDALQIEAVSEPAKRMIGIIFTAFPGVVAAALVIGISYFAGRLIADLITDILTSAGFNGLGEKLGFGNAQLTRITPSRLVGNLVLTMVVMFSLLGATELIGFEPLSQIITEMIQFSIQAALGLVIMALGLFAANKVHDLMVGSQGHSFIASVARVAIIIFTSAMALRQIGLADDIVNLTFGIILGALGIAAAIAIGMGSKDVAGREVEAFIDKLKSKQ